MDGICNNAFTIDLKSSEFAEHILNMLKQAKITDKSFTHFGAESHKYIINPVLSLSDLGNFESKNNITLPEDYRYFITKVGNGGAGPYYGIHPINPNDQDDFLCKEPIISSDMTKEYWQDLVAKRDSFQCDADYEIWEKQLWQGMIEIGTQGCSYDMLLIVSGIDIGKIIYIDRDLSGMPFFINESGFLEWYERWLREVINNYNIYWFGFNMGGDETELIEKYKFEGDIHKRIYIVDSFHKFKQFNIATVSFMLNESKINIPIGLKSSLLKALIEHNVTEADSEIRKILNSVDVNYAIDILQSCPKDKRDKWYKDIISVLVNLDEKHKQTALHYLSGCSRLTINDIYAMTNDDSERVKTAAIYAMGNSKMKKREIKKFIPFLYNDSPQIVHTALQAVNHVKSRKILNAYKDVLKKYHKSDPCYILPNLKIAFRTLGIDYEDVCRKVIGNE